MGGGNSAQNSETANAGLQTQYGQQQQGLSTGYNQLSQQQLGQATALNQPSIDYYKAITSGNPAAALSAVAPQIGNVATQTQQAMGNIRNTVPEGAGRDVLMGQAQLGQGAQDAGLLNNAFTGALQGEQGLAGQALGAGLQEQGATLSALAGATSSLGAANQAYNNIDQAQAQRKAATMGFLGDLVGAGGAVASAGITKSDSRLKEDIEKVGELGDMNIYRFVFKGESQPQLGFMAQEVYVKHPDAVVVGGEDPKESPWMVKYGELIPQLIKESK